MALYPSSPSSAAWSAQCAPHGMPPSGLDSETHHTRSHPVPAPGSKQRGGLSCLFASPNARHASCAAVDSLESSGRSSTDICSLWEGDRCTNSVNIPSSSFCKFWERSPVSVLQGPQSHGSSHGSCVISFAARESVGMASSIDTHAMMSWRRSSSPTVDLRHPYKREEELDVSRAIGYLSTEAELICEELDDETASIIDEGIHQTCGLFPAAPIAIKPPPGHVLKKRDDTTVLPSTDHLLVGAQSRHKIFMDPFIIKAFRLAQDAHEGYFRHSGDPYLAHCVETAVLLAFAGAERAVVAAGLLHDTLDDSNTDEAQLRALFGDDVADLVVGVSKLSQFSQLARDNNIASKSLEADRLRTMFLAMVDVRVVLIKLADRLHNMRTLHPLSPEKQRRISNETLEILVPIANRLGIWNWKAEMEDLCFQYLYPAEYQELASRLADRCVEGVVMSDIRRLDQALRGEDIQFSDLCGRSKNLYSIFSKMNRKGRKIDEICDVRGLRLIVPDEKSCYAALDVVHRLWQHSSKKLKDYVKDPKPNGYQSLHTVVLGDDGLPFEVQIRTQKMHHHAEFGVAAHWRYKEGDDKHSLFLLQRIEWARWVLTWHSEIMDTKMRVSPSQIDLKQSCPFPFHVDNCPHSSLHGGPPESEDDPLFVIMLRNNKMVVQELPPGSTVDCLRKRINEEHSFFSGDSILGDRDLKPKINHRVVESFQQRLRMGDLVEFDSNSSESEPALKYRLPLAEEKKEIDVYREQIKRMYGDGSCKIDARRGFQILESPQIASLS